jgi:hypothetical protein
MSDNPPSDSITSISGSVNLDGKIDVGGDAVGRDKLESAGGHIIHAATGATVIVGGSPAPELAGRGLKALDALMKDSAEVRSAVVEFQTEFRAAHQQLDAVADYKDLHDQLHHLQFHCYAPLVQEAPRFPNGDHALDILTGCLWNLEDIVTQLKQVASRSSLPRSETDWIDEVSAAQTDLGTTIDQPDARQLRRVISRLRSLLAQQPAHINTLLNQMARSLRLQDLIAALSKIANHLSSLNLDADRVGEFQTGLAAFNQLEQSLTALIDDHDGWQKIEDDLWRMEGSLAQDTSELELTWFDLNLKAKTDALCGATNVEWAAALRKKSESLTAALTDGAPTAIKGAFNSYRRGVSTHFFQVDGDLKFLCGELRKVGVPLSSVLGKIT